MATFRNLVEILFVQRERLANRPAVRYKQNGLYRDLRWDTYAEQVKACAAALVDVGVEPGDRVGLLSENRTEWLIADMGIMTAGGVNVPPHAPLTAAQIRFQLEDSGVQWLFVSNDTQLQKIRAIRKELPTLKGVVVFERCSLADGEQSWAGFLQRGRRRLSDIGSEVKQRQEILTLDSLATIMYTSGTTGVPKGVMLTHGNLLSNATGMNETCPRKLDDVPLVWLPFSHIYARTVDHYLNLLTGTAIALAESQDTLIENLAEIRPTHMSSVPRFYEKVLTAMDCGDRDKTAARLRAVFGSRVEWLNSGGAPLPLSVAKAFYDTGLLLLQGYGLTESSPVISFNRKEHYKLETVGQAIPGVEIKIEDDGEILTRGSHVMKGYWKNAHATAEAIRDGWLYTGDLGFLDEDGFLTITGRKKDLMVLSNGKKIVPNHIEGLLLADSCIDQVVVYGEGHNFVTALIVPHWDNVQQHLPNAGIAADPDMKTVDDEVLRAFLEKRIETALQDLSPSERVKRFVVLSKTFSAENDEMTVSLKLRRDVIFRRYGAELENLYAS